MESNRRMLLLMALALALVLSCNVVGSQGDGDGEAGPAAAPADEGQQSTGSSVVVTDGSDLTVCSVFVSPTEDTNWGEDRLGLNTLDPGESQTIAVSSGEYDLRAQDCEADLVDERRAVSVAGPTTWQITSHAADSTLAPTGDDSQSGDRLTLAVSNDTGDDICYLYISPATADSWGDDWLGEGNLLEDDETETFEIAAGSYDLRVEDCDNIPLAEEREADLNVNHTWALR